MPQRLPFFPLAHEILRVRPAYFNLFHHRRVERTITMSRVIYHEIWIIIRREELSSQRESRE